jgi:isopenicillin N synthase-like dioxygenase
MRSCHPAPYPLPGHFTKFMQELPLVDISDVLSGRQDASATAASVVSACESIGFMYVVGHGIPERLISQVYEDVKQFFSLPLEQKQRWQITRSNYRGYIPRQFFSPGNGGAADDYEGYKLHFQVQPSDPICHAFDLYGPNRWPDSPARLQQSVGEYWQACDRVAHCLLAMLAAALDIQPETFLAMFQQPLTNMTLLHYPPRASINGGFGIHPHKDTDALTILAPNPVGGLMVRCRGRSDWLRVDAPPEALVVNIGDMLELWSGGRFVSTPHKVENDSGAERYSFPYFSVPRYDTVVKPLLRPLPGFARQPVPVGEVSREVWRTNWPDTQPQNNAYDLGTLEN